MGNSISHARCCVTLSAACAANPGLAWVLRPLVERASNRTQASVHRNELSGDWETRPDPTYFVLVLLGLFMPEPTADSEGFGVMPSLIVSLHCFSAHCLEHAPQARLREAAAVALAALTPLDIRLQTLHRCVTELQLLRPTATADNSATGPAEAITTSSNRDSGSATSCSNRRHGLWLQINRLVVSLRSSSTHREAKASLRDLAWQKVAPLYGVAAVRSGSGGGTNATVEPLHALVAFEVLKVCCHSHQANSTTSMPAVAVGWLQQRCCEMLENEDGGGHNKRFNQLLARLYIQTIVGHGSTISCKAVPVKCVEQLLRHPSPAIRYEAARSIKWVIKHRTLAQFGRLLLDCQQGTDSAMTGDFASSVAPGLAKTKWIDVALRWLWPRVMRLTIAERSNAGTSTMIRKQWLRCLALLLALSQQLPSSSSATSITQQDQHQGRPCQPSSQLHQTLLEWAHQSCPTTRALALQLLASIRSTLPLAAGVSSTAAAVTYGELLPLLCEGAQASQPLYLRGAAAEALVRCGVLNYGAQTGQFSYSCGGVSSKWPSLRELFSGWVLATELLQDDDEVSVL